MFPLPSLSPRNSQQTARKTIEREIRKYLRKYIKQKKLTLAELNQLYQKILESVKTYG
jgi:DNA-binding protein Fis